MRGDGHQPLESLAATPDDQDIAGLSPHEAFATGYLWFAFVNLATHVGEMYPGFWAWKVCPGNVERTRRWLAMRGNILAWKVYEKDGQWYADFYPKAAESTLPAHYRVDAPDGAHDRPIVEESHRA